MTEDEMAALVSEFLAMDINQVLAEIEEEYHLKDMIARAVYDGKDCQPLLTAEQRVFG